MVGSSTTRRQLAAALALLASAPAAASAQQTVTLPARDRILADRPAQVYTIGRAEGQSWEMFSGIRGLAFDGADNLYVLDGQNHRVVVFDSRGRFVRQFGKRGGGPGELQAPLHIVIDRDGHVVVNDLANRAFVVFTTAGEHVRNVPYSADIGMPAAGMLADPRGGVLVRGMAAELRQGAASAAAPSASTVWRQPLAANAAATAALRIPITVPSVSTSGGGGQPGRFVVNMDPVFSPRISFGVLPDGSTAWQHESEYAVKISDANGRHVRTINRAIRPRRVTRQDQEAYRERQRNGSGGGFSVVMTGGSAGSNVSVGGAADRQPLPADLRSMLPEPTFAEFMSVIASVRTDAAGRIWIQRRADDGSDRGPIDLADATGRYIGTLPAQQAPVAFSRSGLAGYIVLDDLGIERVAVRRLPESWK